MLHVARALLAGRDRGGSTDLRMVCNAHVKWCPQFDGKGCCAHLSSRIRSARSSFGIAPSPTLPSECLHDLTSSQILGMVNTSMSWECLSLRFVFLTMWAGAFHHPVPTNRCSGVCPRRRDGIGRRASYAAALWYDSSIQLKQKHGARRSWVRPGGWGCSGAAGTARASPPELQCASGRSRRSAVAGSRCVVTSPPLAVAPATSAHPTSLPGPLRHVTLLETFSKTVFATSLRSCCPRRRFASLGPVL